MEYQKLTWIFPLNPFESFFGTHFSPFPSLYVEEEETELQEDLEVIVQRRVMEDLEETEETEEMAVAVEKEVEEVLAVLADILVALQSPLATLQCLWH